MCIRDSILGDRLGKLQAAFAQAQAEWDYTGGYTAVYPIKVNHHRGVAGTLASHHGCLLYTSRCV